MSRRESGATITSNNGPVESRGASQQRSMPRKSAPIAASSCAQNGPGSPSKLTSITKIGS